MIASFIYILGVLQLLQILHNSCIVVPRIGPHTIAYNYIIYKSIEFHVVLDSLMKMLGDDAFGLGVLGDFEGSKEELGAQVFQDCGEIAWDGEVDL